MVGGWGLPGPLVFSKARFKNYERAGSDGERSLEMGSREKPQTVNGDGGGAACVT